MKRNMKRMKSLAILLGLFATLVMAGQSFAAKTPPASAININTASVGQLMELPGIGQSKADAIVGYRTQQKFTSKEDLLNIKGIGEKLLARLSSHVTVSGKSGKTKPGTAGKTVR